MSTFNVGNIENRSGGAPDFSQGLTVGGTDISTLVTMTEYHTGASAPSSPANGAIWYDGTVIKQYINDGWYTLSAALPPANSGNRGVFGAGNLLPSYAASNAMDYITISTTGNATDFGDMVANNSIYGGCSNGSRGLFGGGYPNNSGNTTTIDYITIATTGNAQDFGDLTVARRSLAALSDGTKGVFTGGFVSGDTNTLDYVTVATTGNAIDFGDLTVAGTQGGCCADFVRGVIRQQYSATNAYSYITVATTGNATVFGNSTLFANQGNNGCADATRGVFAVYNKIIEYITIQTAGNATDFGDLIITNSNNSGAVANSTRAVWAGGQSGLNAMNYVTIQTLGDAADFGDLALARYGLAGASGE